MTIEYLEFAFMSGKVKGPAYSKECRNLLNQVKVQVDRISGFKGLSDFMQKYDLTHCKSALTNIKRDSPSDTGTGQNTTLIVDITQKYVSSMDVIEVLPQVDNVYPQIQDLLASLKTFSDISASSPIMTQVSKWVAELEKKGATECLDEEEIRQLKMDLTRSYEGF
eukprot:CAMPEP_0170479156 /NCGR_PEP_ID=MMETSP0208-20121228/488_1 /TAXON_ID=197538 /ORGANISM="Strombidium inclinatum, Strain S3" /LENGTH=165 /DNA_ID=CAMNT_0010751505 /DNA_START=87 /DNA_END=581 /DNA_ORIENTATION=+